VTTVSFVLRLLPERLAAGEVVGEVRRVGDDRAAFVSNLEALAAFLLAAASPQDHDRDREPE
jgi:hypothetical protein